MLVPAELIELFKQVVKASSRVHGGGTEFKLTLKAAQGDMPATVVEVGYLHRAVHALVAIFCCSIPSTTA
jgi:hypothetical protein